MTAGTVALIGRPNAGKSTLLNRLIGQKLAIVSDKPQTTRHRIVGVKNAEGGQIVFVDTPGLHKPQHRMNVRMVDLARNVIADVDLAVLIVDASVPPGTGDRYVMDLVQAAKTPVILALNKVDLLKKKTALLPLMESYSRALPLKAVVPISAWAGDGVADLEREILAALPEGDPLYDKEFLTDQTVRTLAAELIREKVLRHTHDELPHATAVVIEQFGEPDESGLYHIHASILVDRTSQKAIVVGKAGAMVKLIGTEARHDLEEMLGGRVFLDLHVKVREDWRDDERMLDELGLGRRS